MWEENDGLQGDIGTCNELGRKGNCASAQDLLLSLRAVVEGGIFAISEDDQRWLKSVMSSVPSDFGYPNPDEYCRFVSLSGLQKCVFHHSSQQWSNIAFFPSYNAYVWIVVTPPDGTSEEEIIDRIDTIVKTTLSNFKGLEFPTDKLQ